MKRIIFISTLLLAGTAMLLWYFFMRRQIPEHAACIPKNAIAVVTLNMKELALDNASKEHLFPVDEKEVLPKEIRSFLDMADQNGGSGLKETADVLAFFFQDGEDAWIGISMGMHDQKKFDDLVRLQFSKKFRLNPVSGANIVRFDTTSAFLGWNKDLAVFLYPFGNTEPGVTATECNKLLTLQKENSILSEQKFREHELSDFDAGVYLQVKPFLTFTNGGKLFRAYLHDDDLVTMNIDFQNGGTYARTVITKASDKIDKMGPLVLPCESGEVKGFIRTKLELANDSLVQTFIDAPPMNDLPFSDEELALLAPLMDGNNAYIIHDTMSYNKVHTPVKFDPEFRMSFGQITTKENTFGVTECFTLKDGKKANALIKSWLDKDSTVFENGGWTITTDGLRQRLFVNDNMLTWTNWPGTDGRSHVVPENWQSFSTLLMPGDLVQNFNGLFSYMLLNISGREKELHENLDTFSISAPIVKGNTVSYDTRLLMKNTKINALVQLEDIFRK